MAKLQFFPTFLYTERLPLATRRRLNSELLSDTLKLEQHDHQGRTWSQKNYQGGYTSYSSFFHLHRQFSAFIRLQELLRPHVLSFVRALHWDLRGGRLEMTTCWTSRMPRHVYHTMHTHPLSVVSGTYYVQVPPGTSSLKIEDPRMGFMMNCPPRRKTAPLALQNYINLKPQAGRFYLFESWLRHEVPPNPVEGDRISVSFNYEWVP